MGDTDRWADIASIRVTLYILVMRMARKLDTLSSASVTLTFHLYVPLHNRCFSLSTHYQPLKDIGYAIIPSHRRQGYATEAAITVKNYWISFGFKEITGFCLPDNEPSNKLIMKMGFERGGEALANGAIVVNAYVLPGMKHCTVETTRFNRMGVDKD